MVPVPGESTLSPLVSFTSIGDSSKGIISAWKGSISMNPETANGALRHIGAAGSFPGAFIFHVEATTSTMDDARIMASQDAREGTSIVADFQSKGRGRFKDRVWMSERAKNLLVSIILDRPGLAALPLRLGLALAQAIEDSSAETRKSLRGRIAIKWPNDILVDGRKIAGLVCETAARRVLVGMGVNCNQVEFPPVSSLFPPDSLCRVLGSPVDRFRLLDLILHKLPDVLQGDAWKESVEQVLFWRGKRVLFKPGIGDSPLEGTLVGISTEGALILDLPGTGRKTFASGEMGATIIADGD